MTSCTGPYNKKKGLQAFSALASHYQQLKRRGTVLTPDAATFQKIKWNPWGRELAVDPSMKHLWRPVQRC